MKLLKLTLPFLHVKHQELVIRAVTNSRGDYCNVLYGRLLWGSSHVFKQSRMKPPD